MADLLMILTFVAFIGLCVAYVRWCDRIIGPDPVPSDTAGADDASTLTTEVAA
jgi:hypothetical protein